MTQFPPSALSAQQPMPTSLADFEQLLKHILSPNNQLRNQAEQTFQLTKQKQPDVCVGSLVQLLRTCQDAQVRELSCILLRKCTLGSSDESIYSNLSAPVQDVLKKQLITAIELEPLPSIRKKLTYAIAGLASGLLDSGAYPELLPSMFAWSNSPSVQHREASLLIFNQLATYLLDQGLVPHLNALHTIFAKALIDPESNKVRIAAVEALVSVLLVLDKSHLSHFSDLIPVLFQLLSESIFRLADFASSETILESLITVAEHLPHFFYGRAPNTLLENIVDSMIAVTEIPSSPENENIRHLAMEFLFTWMEHVTASKKTALKNALRKNGSDRLRKIFIRLMEWVASLNLDDVEEFENQIDDDEEDDEERGDWDVGLEGLDRISVSLGGKLVAPVAFETIPRYLSDKVNWKHPNAGLMALCQCAEGCKEQFEKILDQIIPMIISHFGDQHPRVRYSAIHTIAQFCTDFAPERKSDEDSDEEHEEQETNEFDPNSFGARFGAVILAHLSSALSDVSPRVQSHAASAIINVADVVPRQTILVPVLPELLNKLLVILIKDNQKKKIQENVISSIASLATASGRAFIPYYAQAISLLKLVLTKATNPNQKTLRAKAIEAVSLIALAVGKETFAADASEVLSILFLDESLVNINLPAPVRLSATPALGSSQEGSEKEGDDDDDAALSDPQFPFLLQAFARFAKILRQEFVPFLGSPPSATPSALPQRGGIMALLLKLASAKPDVIVTDADEDATEDEDGMESVTLSIRGVGDKRISIRTTILDDKALALSILGSLIQDLKKEMFPFLETLISTIVPLVRFAYLDEIRETAATICPDLISCLIQSMGGIEAFSAGSASLENLRMLLEFIGDNIVQALKVEPETTTSIVFSECLSECLKACPKGTISANSSKFLDTTVQSLVEFLKIAAERRAALESEHQTLLEEEKLAVSAPHQQEGADDEEDAASEINKQITAEEDLLSSISDLIGDFMKHTPAFMPYFVNLLWPVFTAMMASDRTVIEKKIALCVLCDFVEYGHGVAWSNMQLWQTTILAPLVMYANTSEPDTRQPAVYGLGVCAEVVPQNAELFDAHLLDITRTLIRELNRPDARSEAQISCTTNVASSIFKIAMRMQKSGTAPPARELDPSTLLALWRDALPGGGDVVESRIVHKNLVELVKSGNPVIIGAAHEHIPRIIKIFASIVDTELIEDQTLSDIGALLRYMQTNINTVILQQTWGSLTPDERSKLQRLVSTTSAH